MIYPVPRQIPQQRFFRELGTKLAEIRKFGDISAFSTLFAVLTVAGMATIEANTSGDRVT
jgi:hypothetical protein